MFEFIYPINILHISDLHRSPSHHISNDVLTNSLESAFSKEDKALQKIDFIVVSGDIINGTTIQDNSAIDELNKQYEEAYEFLSGLSATFLKGDNSRVIIVPGNHDVSWYYSRQSMKNFEYDMDINKQLNTKRELYKSYVKGNNNIRWSWESFEFLDIVDQEKYNKRLEPFMEFYKKFYNGKRDYSLNPVNQYDIFDFPYYNLTFVAFNSCYNNDHCNSVGKIHPDCLAKVSRVLRQRYSKRLVISVWHHNTRGLPNQMDYLEPSILQNLIDSHVCIGLHGHQHKSEVVNEEFRLNSTKKITLISTGSLCAAPSELPTGQNRSYNLIGINIADKKIEVHKRCTIEDCFDSPIWIPGSIGIAGKKLEEISLSIEEDFSDQYLFNILSQAEKLISDGDYEMAMQQLEGQDFDNDLVRYMLLECYMNLNKYEKILNKYDPPKSDREILYLINSIKELKDKSKLKQVLNYDIILKSSDKAVQEEVIKCKRRLVI